jgi:predicted metal-dependent hydrolase
MITVSVKTSGRRRFSASLRIAENRQVDLSIPQGYTIHHVADLLAKQYLFLAKSVKISAKALKWPLKSGQKLPIFGREITIQLGAKKNSLKLDEFSIKTNKSSLTQIEFYTKIAPFLEDYIVSNIKRLAPQMKIEKYGTVRMKLTKSQWGSCTLHGNLSFSKRLIHYSAECIEYVVIHELAHIHEHNHGRAFWNIVKEHCPDYRELRKTLKQRVFG